ncbi:MAG: Gfo/Idh/MocA family oxidoreductase, partial [Actinomycetota bacterium]|nr:Gfo/Idh/MocA family oxidoreductase [Actinomycetota bacterium]
AHAHALHSINHMAPLSRPVRLVAMAGRRAGQVERVAQELGFERWTTSWEEVVEAPDVHVVAALAPNDVHAAPMLAALEQGKAVLCEKPLARCGEEAGTMLEAAKAAGSTNCCAFNYRFVPAVRLARELVASGRMGRLRHFRAVYLQDWAASPQVPRTWRFQRSRSGSGAVGDYSHLVDLLHYLAGSPLSVSAEVSRFIHERPDPTGSGELLPVDVDDAYAAIIEVEGGVLASLEASRCATGWKGRQVIELNASEGSLWWDMEDLNRLHVFRLPDEAEGLGGFRDVLVTQPDHPFMQYWWAPGHILGWEHTFFHQWRDFLQAAVEGAAVGQHQAGFEDGYRAAVVCDAILEAAERGRRVPIPVPAAQTELEEAAGG